LTDSSAIWAPSSKATPHYPSWFSDKDFVDLPAFLGKLQPEPTSRDPLSKYLYENLSGRTTKIGFVPDRKAPILSRCLAQDLKRSTRAGGKLEETARALEKQKRRLDNELAYGPVSDRLLGKRGTVEKEDDGLIKGSGFRLCNKLASAGMLKYHQQSRRGGTLRCWAAIHARPLPPRLLSEYSH